MVKFLREVAIVGYQSESRRPEHLLPFIIHRVGSLASFTLHIHCQLAIWRIHCIVVGLCADSAEQQNTTLKNFFAFYYSTI